ncbi:MAG: 16S rRNA (cytosine(967)-C(5))-methyltransferase RsmB [Ruminococcaceae bacterium]|nr:16S rRNA (cytosine(967)-C(5))-methyltransferase RsmB [Oscillospiraceae bacterium]
MKPVTSRECALRVLQSVRSAAAWSDAALKAQLERDQLTGAEAALATRLVYGVMQNRMLLDFWISAYCTQNPNHLQTPLLDILRLGVYQIVFLDRIPDSAAVNESVNLTRQFGRAQAAGLVNAVLRKVVQNKQNLPTPSCKDAVQYLSITFSHPKWLVKQLISILGFEETEAFLRTNNGAVPTIVQYNPLRTDGENLVSRLSEEGVKAIPHSWVPGCFTLTGTGNLAALKTFQNGDFLVQDAAAHLVTAAAQPLPGMRVIDVCAAPGGKSFAAAFAMQDQGEIFSCDLHENKLKRIREGAQRLGIRCIRTIAADGRIANPDWIGSADLVIVDAPCSGLGIIRKKPDIRYKNPNELFALPVIQTAILENAAGYVKPGGTLVYSTCTILPEENQQITDAFLAEHSEFSRESFALPDGRVVADGQITFWPQRDDVDGFYICRMKRRQN